MFSTAGPNLSDAVSLNFEKESINPLSSVRVVVIASIAFTRSLVIDSSNMFSVPVILSLASPSLLAFLASSACASASLYASLNRFAIALLMPPALSIALSCASPKVLLLAFNVFPADAIRLRNSSWLTSPLPDRCAKSTKDEPSWLAKALPASVWATPSTISLNPSAKAPPSFSSTNPKFA